MAQIAHDTGRVKGGVLGKKGFPESKNCPRRFTAPILLFSTFQFALCRGSLEDQGTSSRGFDSV